MFIELQISKEKAAIKIITKLRENGSGTYNKLREIRGSYGREGKREQR